MRVCNCNIGSVNANGATSDTPLPKGGRLALHHDSAIRSIENVMCSSASKMPGWFFLK
jgi:hypothetical protein